MNGKHGRYDLPRRFQTVICAVSRVPFFSVLQSITAYYHGLCLLGQTGQNKQINCSCLPPVTSSAYQFLEYMCRYTLKPMREFASLGEMLIFKANTQLAMQYTVVLPSHGGLLHKP